jgi:hypothetical protein
VLIAVAGTLLTIVAPAALADTPGSFEQPWQPDTSGLPSAGVVAVSPTGDVAAAWVTEDRAGNGPVSVAVRHSGASTWSDAVVVSEAGHTSAARNGTSVHLRYGADGALYLIWWDYALAATQGHVMFSERLANSTQFTAPVDIDGGSSRGWPGLAVGAGGAIAIDYTTVGGLTVAYRAAAETTWTVHEYGDTMAGYASIAIDRAGYATLVYQSEASQALVCGTLEGSYVNAATITPQGTFGDPVTISTPGDIAYQPSLAVSDDGSTMIAYTQVHCVGSAPIWVHAAYRASPTSAFSTAQELASTRLSNDVLATGTVAAITGSGDFAIGSTNATSNGRDSAISFETARVRGTTFSHGPHVAIAVVGTTAVVADLSLDATTGAYSVVYAGATASGTVLTGAAWVAAVEGGTTATAPRPVFVATAGGTATNSVASGNGTIAVAASWPPKRTIATFRAFVRTPVAATPAVVQAPVLSHTYRALAVGDAVTTDDGSYGPGCTVLTTSYTWQRSTDRGAHWTPLPGTSATFRPRAVDVNATVRAIVRATCRHATGTVTSTTAPSPAIAPGLVRPVVLRTKAKVGTRLVPSGDRWSPTKVQRTYLWERWLHGIRVHVGTRATYALRAADVLAAICVTVTARVGHGPTNSTTACTATVTAHLAARPSSPPTRAGRTRASYGFSRLSP